MYIQALGLLTSGIILLRPLTFAARKAAAVVHAVPGQVWDYKSRTIQGERSARQRLGVTVPLS